MADHVLVWDLETIPDLPCVARVHSLAEHDEAAARENLGEKFPKLPFHKIFCIAAPRPSAPKTAGTSGIWVLLMLAPVAEIPPAAPGIVAPPSTLRSNEGIKQMAHILAALVQV